MCVCVCVSVCVNKKKSERKDGSESGVCVPCMCACQCELFQRCTQINEQINVKTLFFMNQLMTVRPSCFRGECGIAITEREIKVLAPLLSSVQHCAALLCKGA